VGRTRVANRLLAGSACGRRRRGRPSTRSLGSFHDMAAIGKARRFVAEDTGVDVNEDAVTVGFARDVLDEHSDDAIMVQRGKDPGDDSPGVAGIYVEIPPQRYVTVGGITSATLRRSSFEIRFTQKAAQAMGGNRAFLAEFNADAKSFRAIRDGLRFVFQGCACYKERA
jgi:hypothetical protein